jgi:hypothetical protein
LSLHLQTESFSLEQRYDRLFARRSNLLSEGTSGMVDLALPVRPAGCSADGR